jgi:hypothetical protein
MEANGRSAAPLSGIMPTARTSTMRLVMSARSMLRPRVMKLSAAPSLTMLSSMPVNVCVPSMTC